MNIRILVSVLLLSSTLAYTMEQSEADDIPPLEALMHLQAESTPEAPHKNVIQKIIEFIQEKKEDDTYEELFACAYPPIIEVIGCTTF